MWLALVFGCAPDPVDPGPEVPSGTDPTPTPTEPTPTGPAACGPLASVEGEAALQGRGVVHVDQAACTAGVHASAGARDSVLHLRVDAGRDVLVSVADPGGRTLLEATPVGAHDRTALEVVPQVSGEVLVDVRPVEPVDEPWDYALAVECAEGCDRPFSRYPVLLMHGLSGSDTVFGVDYFYQVTSTLSAEGIEIASPGVAPFADSVTRAGEWELYVGDLMARGHRRVNLIGHSQGGIDARILASPAGRDRGDVVASVTTLGTPHRGTPIADLVLLGFDGGLVDAGLFDIGVSVFSSILGLQSDDPEFVGAMEQLAEETMVPLDAVYVDHPDTWYGSWLGHSCGILEPMCQNRMDGEIVDPLLSASYLLIWPRQNDGLVPVDSQSHGIVLGEVPADHADEIGQIADTVPDPFDHLGFYRNEVLRLEALGL